MSFKRSTALSMRPRNARSIVRTNGHTGCFERRTDRPAAEVSSRSNVARGSFRIAAPTRATPADGCRDPRAVVADY